MTDVPSVPAFPHIIIDIAKLRDYCLSPSHPHGRHKARVFRARLGLQRADAELLRGALIDAVQNSPGSLVPTRADKHGQHYTLTFEMSTALGRGTIRSMWILRTGHEDVLRFITCYVR